MRDLFSPDYMYSMNLEEKADTVSTVLVPERLLPILEENFSGISLKLVLKSLLKKYRWLFVSGQFPFSPRVKCLFQSVGLNLHPMKFRPDNRDWLELGIFAYSLGYSRCLLFSLLLELEERGLSVYEESPEARKVVATITRGIPVKRWVLRSGRKLFLRNLSFLR